MGGSAFGSFGTNTTTLKIGLLPAGSKTLPESVVWAPFVQFRWTKQLSGEPGGQLGALPLSLAENLLLPPKPGPLELPPTVASSPNVSASFIESAARPLLFLFPPHPPEVHKRTAAESANRATKGL